MSNYTLYNGKFVCHTCKAIVSTLRSYAETKELTWMCKEKHLSKVTLVHKRKKDYEREERK
ncbi:hypothetical protein UFOVP828_6 [uncultured Caudovirales phage]|uniref:Uncharacterized protein n=1 Tax=uncultured Caudovirales phage TaxID=2100421 RepID=A0A6J5P9K8_9CAUD|nr:hypothetical protein UFOVP828_6 [uncultured Caudovirales phage]